MKLVTVPQMIAIEQEANAGGLTYERMMENAGSGLAEIVEDLQVPADDRQILGLVGPGNNGGDTLVALSLLAAAGWRTHAYLVKRDRDALFERFLKAGGEITAAEADEDAAVLIELIGASTILLDGLLGTGAKPPLRGEIRAAVVAANRCLANLDSTPYVVAVDCPSGVDCDSGEAPNECIPADLTVTMAAVKQGLLKMPAYELVGDLRVVDIDLPPSLPSLQAIQNEVVEENLVASILPDRPATAHKGTFGTAMIVAGSVNYTGAALLAGEAAYRVGAGLVTLAVPSPLHGTLAGRLPEATWLLLPHELGVIARDAAAVLADALGPINAMLLGPGFGTEETTQDFIYRLLNGSTAPSKADSPMGFVGAGRTRGADARGQLPPLVVDADGLKLLSRIKDWHKLLPPTAILTPHPGEMSVLTGLSKEQIQNDRSGVASRFAAAWGHVVVLKGAFTVIAAPEGRIAIIPVASAALARAGTGDVLAGVIVGLRAQGMAPYEAAMAGAWIHAQAGLRAESQIGNSASVLAGDVLGSVADVISDLPAA